MKISKNKKIIIISILAFLFIAYVYGLFPPFDVTLFTFYSQKQPTHFDISFVEKTKGDHLPSEVELRLIPNISVWPRDYDYRLSEERSGDSLTINIKGLYRRFGIHPIEIGIALPPATKHDFGAFEVGQTKTLIIKFQGKEDKYQITREPSENIFNKYKITPQKGSFTEFIEEPWIIY